jgi:hypothetical protein
MEFLSRDESKGLARRRRARNWVMFAVLFGICALFYAITVVKLGNGTLRLN